MLMAIVGFIAIGCSGGGGTTPPPPLDPTLTGLTIAASATTVQVGNTANFAATGTFSDGSTQDLTNQATWTTSNPAIGTVADGTGVFTGSAAGTTDITGTATVNGVAQTSAAVTMTVQAATLTSIAVESTTAAGDFLVLQGSTLGLRATGTFSFGPTQDLTGTVQWGESNPAIGTVAEGTGVFTALTPGVTNVTATDVSSGTVSPQRAVRVTNPLPGLVAIAINAPGTAPPVPGQNIQLALTVGQTVNFTATGNFGGAFNDITSDVRWSSSDPTVGFVRNAGGAFTALKAGQTIINAQALDAPIEAGTKITVTVK